MIKKSDGATLYITRDIATAMYRARTYNFVKNIYAVGQEQANHFRQLKAVLKKMGFDWSDDMIHVDFGLVTKNRQKLSTRKRKYHPSRTNSSRSHLSCQSSDRRKES